MKAMAFLGGLLMTGVMAYPQRGPINAATMSPVRAMPAPINATRHGNILFPGGTPSSFPSNLGRTVAGVPYTGVPHGYPGYGSPGYGRHRNRTIVVPYAVPVFSGGYGYGYGYPDPYFAQQQQPNVTVVMPQQPPPTVIINNHYGSGQAPESTTVAAADGEADTGGLRVYEATPRRAERPAPSKPVAEPAQPGAVRTYVRDDKPNIYAIALRDGTSREAIGYWIKGGELQFVTPRATIGAVALDQVDVAETRKINAERKLDFELNIP